MGVVWAICTFLGEMSNWKIEPGSVPTLEQVTQCQQEVKALLQNAHEIISEIEKNNSESRTDIDQLWRTAKEASQDPRVKLDSVKAINQALLSSSIILSECNRTLYNNLNKVIQDKVDLELLCSAATQEQSAELNYALQDIKIHASATSQANFFTGPCDIVAQLRVWNALHGIDDSLKDDILNAIEENKTVAHDHKLSNETEQGDPESADAISSYGFLDFNDSKAYPFQEEDRPDNILVVEGSDVRKIKAGTLPKLVEELTGPSSDTNFRYVFLLTYNSFTTATALLDLLEARFDVPVPPNLTRKEIAKFKSENIDKIRIKVCSVLKNWIDEHFGDFSGNPQLSEQLQTLIRNMLGKSKSIMITKLASSLSTRLKRGAAGLPKRTDNDGKLFPISLMKPLAANQEFSFLDTNETEIARQLSLIDFSKLASIQPREFLGQAWSKKDKDVRAPNIISMISQFNKVSIWTQRVIISEQDIKVRAALFSKMIKICAECHKLNNFYSTFAIYCGLTTNATFRLKRTKELVDPKLMSFLEEDIKTLFSVDMNSQR